MQIQTHFTKDKKVKKIILNHLDTAKNHVCVAVAWFTDRILFDKLIELLDNEILYAKAIRTQQEVEMDPWCAK